MRILIDTNIILRLTQSENPVHADIVKVVTLLRQRSVELCIVPQNLYEFWVVATRPIASNGLGMSSQTVKQSIDFLLIDFVLLRDERGDDDREQMEYGFIDRVASLKARLGGARRLRFLDYSRNNSSF